MMEKIKILFAAIFAIFVLQVPYRIYEGFIDRADYLYWDPALHAYDGLKIALDIKTMDILRLLRDTNRLAVWPPLHSYIQAPFYIFLGSSFLSSTFCSLTFFVLFYICITLVYSELSRSTAGWAVLLAFVSTSPMYLGFATMPMLEIFGATLAAFSIWLYFKGSRYFPLSLTLLFFLKYNYCIYLLLPLAAIQFLYGERDTYLALLKSFIKSPFGIFVTCYVLVLLIILITGGFKIGTLSVRGIGNPLYALLLIVLVWSLRADKRKLWSNLMCSDWKYFVIPVLLWLVIPVPNRVKSLVAFSINRSFGSESLTSMDYYFYYFRALPEYFSNTALFLISIVTATFVAIRYRKDRKVVFLVLYFVLPLMLLSFNPNKGTRQLFTFIFPLWLLCAFAAAQIKPRVLSAACAIVLCALLAISINRSSIHNAVAWPFLPREYYDAVHYISSETANCTDIRILGTNNEFSPGLLMYHIRKASDFRQDQRFGWDLRGNILSGTHVIAIGKEGPGKMLSMTHFANGLIIRHYLVD